MKNTNEFKCKGCGHCLPAQFNVRTPGYCYMCDPNITLEECLRNEPFKMPQEKGPETFKGPLDDDDLPSFNQETIITMENEFKVYQITHAHNETSLVCARTNIEAIHAYCKDTATDIEEILKDTVSEFPKEWMKWIKIVSNEPEEMPDMTLEQWMQAEGTAPSIICSTEFLD